MIKSKKRLFSLLIVFVLLISSPIFFRENITVRTYAEFEETADETVSNIVFGWNLGNSLDSYTGTTMGIGSISSETSWGNPKTTKEMIDMVKDTGINAIRVPVTWYNHMDPDTYEIDEEWLARVEEVVGYVLDNDMYCIINVHHDTGEKGWLKASSTNLEENKVIFTAIWEQVAQHFNEYGDKLLFEGFNEILNDSSEWVHPDDEALEITNELNQIFVDTVRSSGGNNAKRNLIVNTYCAGGNSQVTSGFVMPTDTVENKLIVEAHVYQPFYFTSESYPNVTTWSKGDLNTYLTNMYTTFVQNDIPVIIGEFGCVDKDNALERLSWAQYYVDTCTNYGIKCFWWDNGSQYKIFNRRTLKCTETELLEAMLTEANGGDYVINTAISGDANNDGVVTAADVEQLQEFLTKKTTEIQNCDLNKDEKINVFDLILLKRMIAEQQNLCASEDNWTSWIDENNGASATVEYLDNGISVTVESSGVKAWNIQALYQNLTLEKDAVYQISFDYTSTSEQNMPFHIMQAYGSYTSYYSETLTYSTEVQHYESTFTMTYDTDTNMEIAFNFGASTLDEPYTMTIQNLSLIKLS